MLTASGTAAAQYVAPPPDSGVASDEVVQTKINDALVPSRPVAQSQGATSSGLAVTGGDVLGLAGIGVGAVAMGAALLAARRRLSLS